MFCCFVCQLTRGSLGDDSSQYPQLWGNFARFIIKCCKIVFSLIQGYYTLFSAFFKHKIIFYGRNFSGVKIHF